MNWKFNSNHITFLKFENPSSRPKVRQQLCYQVAAVTAALVAAWLLGSSSIEWKFNSNHFTFLKFENPSSGSEVMTCAMTTLTHCAKTDRQKDKQTDGHTEIHINSIRINNEI